MMMGPVFLQIVVLAAIGGSVFESSDTAKLIGGYKISESGEFLFCGVKTGRDDRRYVIVPLRDREHRKPRVLSFPGTDKCLSAAWRPGKRPEELLFVTPGESWTIKTFRVSSTGIDEVSSYPMDTNLLGTLPPGCWNPSGNILALRIWRSDGDSDARPLLGFSRDGGKTIRVSDCELSDAVLLWTGDTTFYMASVVGADETMAHTVEVMGMETTVYDVYIMELLKAELNPENMTVTTQRVLQGNNIYLAEGNPRGSLVYTKENEIVRDGKVLAVMPEKIEPPFVDGDYVSAVSSDGRKLFVLDATGKVISQVETREESTCIGISAANQCVYLTASEPDDRTKIYAYDFFGKKIEVVFEADGTGYETAFLDCSGKTVATELRDTSMELWLRLSRVWWAGFKVLCRWFAFTVVLWILWLPVAGLMGFLGEYVGRKLGIVLMFLLAPIPFYFTSRYLLMLDDKDERMTEGDKGPRGAAGREGHM